MAAWQLHDDLPPITPVFLFGLSSPVHRALVGYKAGLGAASRAARAGALGGVLGGFLAGHCGCVLGTARTATLVPVPSSVGGRQSWHGTHPVSLLCERAAAEVPRFDTAELLRPGARPPRRLDAGRHRYEVESDGCARGRKVVVVDDMFVSGSRALSAAATLSDAGAIVLAVIPLGRLVRSDHNAATAAFFAARSEAAFDPARCVVCGAGPKRGVVAWRAGAIAVSERLAA